MPPIIKYCHECKYCLDIVGDLGFCYRYPPVFRPPETRLRLPERIHLPVNVSNKACGEFKE